MKSLIFKTQFIIPTDDLKGWTRKLFNVRSNIDGSEVNSDPVYKVTLPDIIFNELVDTEPQFKSKYETNLKCNPSGLFDAREIQRKFKKTQTSTSINALQRYFQELTTFINEKHSIESSTLKKKIYIIFYHTCNHTRNNLNGAYKGKRIVQSFQYFTGYEVLTDKLSGAYKKIQKKHISKILYSPKGSTTSHLDTDFKENPDLFLPLPSMNQSVESFEKEYSIIDWSEERESFCLKIQEAFESVNKELSSFLSNMDTKQIDQLIKSNQFKFLQ